MDQHSLPNRPQKTALLVGTDDMLLYTRKAILEKEGFDVGIESPLVAIESVGTCSHDVIIACHTLHVQEADALVQAARANPSHPALIGFSKNLIPAPTAHPFDGSVWSLALPETFISKLHEVLGLGKPCS